MSLARSKFTRLIIQGLLCIRAATCHCGGLWEFRSGTWHWRVLESFHVGRSPGFQAGTSNCGGLWKFPGGSLVFTRPSKQNLIGLVTLIPQGFMSLMELRKAHRPFSDLRIDMTSKKCAKYGAKFWCQVLAPSLRAKLGAKMGVEVGGRGWARSWGVKFCAEFFAKFFMCYSLPNKFRNKLRAKLHTPTWRPTSTPNFQNFAQNFAPKLGAILRALFGRHVYAQEREPRPDTAHYPG